MLFTGLLIFSYLLGSVPFGLLLAKIFASTDIRNFGSKNIGATNVNRVLGKKLGIATFLLDALKGVVVILLAKYYFHLDFTGLLTIAIMAVLGHIFSIYLKFKGGKGVATFLACSVALQPFLGLAGLFLWLSIYLIFKISSLAGIFSCLIIGLFAGLFGFTVWQHLLWLALAMIIVAKHYQNIIRLLNNTEK
jgi:glycerol-3-phosphate acyltransferase PlsY